MLLVKYIGVFEMIALCFSMQEEDAIEHTIVKCHVFTLTIDLLTIV